MIINTLIQKMINANKPKYYGIFNDTYGEDNITTVTNGFEKTDTAGLAVKVPNGVKTVLVSVMNNTTYSNVEIMLNGISQVEITEAGNIILDVSYKDVIKVGDLTRVPSDFSFTVVQLA